MKTYIQPLIQEQQLDTHPVMLDSSEIDITDEPVNPRGSANSRRDSWGDLWEAGAVAPVTAAVEQMY